MGSRKLSETASPWGGSPSGLSSSWAWHNLCPIDGDQVLDSGGFCGWMDRVTAAPPSPRSTEACILMAPSLSSVRPTMWWNMRHSSTTCALLLSSWFSIFTYAMALSSLSTKSWGSRIATTPAWQHTDKRLANWRTSLMVLSFITSFGETMRQPTPSPGSGPSVNRPLRVCSHSTYSSLPSSLRKMA
jgi:hypothetical protein